MSPDYQLTSLYLDRAIEEFDNNPVAARFMRRLANEGPEIFFNIAIERLNGEARSNAHRFLALLVLRQDSLLRQLTSPAFSTREHAVNLFRRFLEVDPLSDVRLAQMLPGRNTHSPEILNGVQSARALDILDATSRGRRLLPILGHLPENGDPVISAKATLFVGRRVLSPEWTARQMSRSNQRVRANAIEALWGLKSPAAIQLFEDHAGDSNNRVAGNALVGLHAAGQPGAVDAIIEKSEAANHLLRTTAAWAMGKIGGDQFYHRLAGLVRDEHPDVRSTAVRSIAGMRRSPAKITTPPIETPPLPVGPELAPVELVSVLPAIPDVELRLDGSAYSAKRG